MSKSLGNTIAPQEVIKESGAEILRLWVAMVDYREELRLGKEILARVVEAYRKIRNTLPVSWWRTCTTSIRRRDRVPLDAARGGRPLRAGAVREAARRVLQRLRRVRLPDVFQR